MAKKFVIHPKSLANLLAAFFCVWAIPHLARADYPVAMAALQCDPGHNAALVRFFTVDSSDLNENGALPTTNAPIYAIGSLGTPDLPKSLDEKWSNFPYSPNETCKLRNGQIISVSIRNGINGVGTDQAIPDTYFKLTIGDILVYDEYTFYSSMDQPNAFFNLSAVEYDGHSLLECVPPKQDSNGTDIPGSDPVCKDVSGRLLPGRKYFTEQEQKAYHDDQSKTRLAQDETPFCKRLQKANPSRLTLFGNAAVSGQNTITEQDIDIRNVGSSDQVDDVGSDVPYPSSFLMVFEKDHNGEQKFESDIANNTDADFFGDPENYASTEYGATYISVADINDIVTFEGKNLIYSIPLDPNSVPSGIISRLTPSNKIETVCQFP